MGIQINCNVYFLAPSRNKKVSLCPSVRLSDTSLSKTLNLHLSLIMSVSDQSQVSVSSLNLLRRTDGV